MQERKQLTAELGKAHALIEETAADRFEATELLSRAVHIMESMRDHMSTERQAMWQCILQTLHLQSDATPAQASASFARCVHWWHAAARPQLTLHAEGHTDLLALPGIGALDRWSMQQLYCL